MTSVSIETDVHLLRGVVPEAVAEPAESPFESAVAVLIGGFRRLPSREPGCAHGQLAFDNINDVHCDHCGKDFTD